MFDGPLVILPHVRILGYIGPGAGFAFLGSFFVLAAAVVLAVLSAVSFPLRFTLGALIRTRRRSKGPVRRVVLIGLDGLDPKRVRQFMAEGMLPNFQALADRGVFRELQSTCPPMSPVAWSSFITGVNPGKHNIFDFLNRDLRTCMPELSSSRIRQTRRGRPEVVLLRKSRPFWQLLGEHGVFSTILRVPITFPPEAFYGLSLSAMCTPDLRGSQGTFTLYETETSEGRPTGGVRIPVTLEGRRIRTELSGPTIGRRTLNIPLAIELADGGEAAVLRVCGRRLPLRKGKYSEWTPVTFRYGLRRIGGICRFLLVSARPVFRLYVTPIHIDPERPAMPIAHPAYYATYLAKLHGPFATLGLAEDTWALDEGAIDETAFLTQVYDIHAEREHMFFEALKRTRRGLCCCVFDAPDRIQHTFTRYLDADGAPSEACAESGHGDAVREMYRRMDDLVGRTLSKLDKATPLIVISDHGFGFFRRGVNLNAWLAREGFMGLKQADSPAEYLTNVDWSRTRAYSFGLSGIYLNVRGREARGIVEPGPEKQALKREIMAKLRALKDPSNGRTVVRAVYDSEETYSGPYSDNGPDIIVGFEDGYRVSWETAVGRTDGELVAENPKHWSGDHCIDRSLVPGVLFSSHRFAFTNGSPAITDLAPTILELFGVTQPAYMDGSAWQLAGGREDVPG